MKILSVDVGTTAMKMGVFDASGEDLDLVQQISQDYAINTYNDGLFSDIEQVKWQQAFVQGCKTMADLIAEVDVISLSGTTPGLTAMDQNGEALYPAILMLDQRSRAEARTIIGNWLSYAELANEQLKTNGKLNDDIHDSFKKTYDVTAPEPAKQNPFRRRRKK